jgi:hypothetical protein
VKKNIELKDVQFMCKSCNRKSTDSKDYSLVNNETICLNCEKPGGS